MDQQNTGIISKCIVFKLPLNQFYKIAFRKLFIYKSWEIDTKLRNDNGIQKAKDLSRAEKDLSIAHFTRPFATKTFKTLKD